MTTPKDPEAVSPEKDARSGPEYWAKAFRGTPLAIVAPPYIRFMQGQVSLRRALNFLLVAQADALAGNPRLQPILDDMNSSKESKQAGLNFETFFASTTVIALVSEVEHFFGSAVSTALRLYPGKMGNQTFRLTEILAASTADELIDRAASVAMHDLMYAKPLDYLAGLCEVLSIEKKALEALWPGFVELKARRDLGVHNDWIVNAIYVRKIKEAKLKPPLPLGKRLVPDFSYLHSSIDLCDTLVGVVTDLLGQKWIPIANEMKRATTGTKGDDSPSAA
jgi:hypothetical protein